LILYVIPLRPLCSVSPAADPLTLPQIQSSARAIDTIIRLLSPFQVNCRHHILSGCWDRIIDMESRNGTFFSRGMLSSGMLSFPGSSSDFAPPAAHLQAPVASNVTATPPLPSHVSFSSVNDTQFGTNDDTSYQAVEVAQHSSMLLSHGTMSLRGSDSDSYCGWTDRGSSVSLPYSAPQIGSTSRPARLLRRCKEGYANRRRAMRKQKANCTQCGKEMTQDSLRRHRNEIHDGKKRKKLRKMKDEHNALQ